MFSPPLPSVSDLIHRKPMNSIKSKAVREEMWVELAQFLLIWQFAQGPE